MALREEDHIHITVTKITADIKRSIIREKYTQDAFLDVTLVYDDVQSNIMVKKLKEMECPSRLLNFVTAWHRTD